MMSWFFAVILLVSTGAAMVLGNGNALTAAIPKGAQAGLELALSLTGSLCLWCGIGKLMDAAGLTGFLNRLFSPLLKRIFPSTQTDAVLASKLSANFCANLLGLGNAATPMGIQAAQRLTDGSGKAGNELCRLIVLNTASIQLIPANVAALRSAAGSASPFDILPAVWITSFSSAAMGLLAAWALGRLWKW